MKSLLNAIICLVAAAIGNAAEPPSKFAGRWAGIAEFGQSKYPDLNSERGLLTIEVDHQGVITNGAIRDFAGYARAGFLGPLDSNGRINTITFPIEGITYGEIKLNLGRTTGTGTYRASYFHDWDFRSTIRLWREKKPPKESAPTPQNSNGVPPPPRGSGVHGLIATMSNPWLASQTNGNTQSPQPLPPTPSPATPAP